MGGSFRVLQSQRKFYITNSIIDAACRTRRYHYSQGTVKDLEKFNILMENRKNRVGRVQLYNTSTKEV